MKAKKFAKLNDIEVEDIKNYKDSRIGAQNLTPDVELDIEIEDGEITVLRYDNRWGDGVVVIHGKEENWNYKE